MDIVERLHESPCSGDIGCAHKLCVEAANEIERYRNALNEINERASGDDSWLSKSIDIKIMALNALDGF
jgi:phage tail tape-measure protein